jgi:hypothetical protein
MLQEFPAKVLVQNLLGSWEIWSIADTLAVNTYDDIQHHSTHSIGFEETPEFPWRASWCLREGPGPVIMWQGAPTLGLCQWTSTHRHANGHPYQRVRYF